MDFSVSSAMSNVFTKSMIVSIGIITMVVVSRVYVLKLFFLSLFSSSAFSTLSTASASRSKLLLVASSAGGDNTGGDDINKSLSASKLKEELLSLIPSLPFGGPATNITTSEETCLEIKKMVSMLETLAPLPPLANSSEALETLDGDWQLVYSDASEITNIAKLPFGFCLGPVFQPIDVQGGRLENQALIKHKFLLFSGHTRVVADFYLADMGDVNPVGKVNIGERANVKFQKVVFTLRRLLVLPTFGKIRKTAVPNGRSEQEGAVPSIDITYLDETMRIARGGFGSLFVLIRPTGSKSKAMPMLSKDKVESIGVDPESPSYDASEDILPSGSRD